MIGFKRTPAKLVIIVFLISIFAILLIYVDSTLNEPEPMEEIIISKDLDNILPNLKNKEIHKVQKGESLSIIFEEKNVPLNTAYKIFNFDKNNILSGIRPGDIMEFNYLGENLNNIEIIKDEINSIVIRVSEEVTVEKVKKEIENIISFKQGEISTSFYKNALDIGIPDSIIMDFAYIFGWDIDFIFDVREGDKFSVIFEADYSQGKKLSLIHI